MECQGLLVRDGIELAKHWTGDDVTFAHGQTAQREGGVERGKPAAQGGRQRAEDGSAVAGERDIRVRGAAIGIGYAAPMAGRRIAGLRYTQKPGEAVFRPYACMKKKCRCLQAYSPAPACKGDGLQPFAAFGPDFGDATIDRGRAKCSWKQERQSLPDERRGSDEGRKMAERRYMGAGIADASPGLASSAGLSVAFAGGADA